jgi:hypothetical protein
MRRFNLFALLLLLGCVSILFADKLVLLPDLLKPEQIIHDNDQLYIADGATVLIYSITDFSLKKKFGKAGEGPQEFLLAPQFTYSHADLKLLPDQILVNSVSKMSYFSKEGKFIRETKVTNWAWFLTPLGKNFAGRRTIIENNFRYHIIILLDSNFKNIKEVYRETAFYQPNKTLDPVNRRFAVFNGYNDKLIVDDKSKGLLYIFDANGEKIKTINHPFKRVKFTEAEKKKAIDFYLSDPYIRPQYEATKHLVKWSEYFPYIWDHRPDNNKIYVLTYEQENEKYKFYIFDMNSGKLLKTAWVTMPRINAEIPYPYTIARENVYQLVEDEEEEVWALHVKELR